jgi:hypothetical protein
MGKSKTPVTNLNPARMSENLSEPMKPPLSDETKESKGNLSKGKTNAKNSPGNPPSPKIVMNHANSSVRDSRETPLIPFTQKTASHEDKHYNLPKKTENLYSKNEEDPEVDYDDDSVEEFVSDIFQSKTSTKIPSSSLKDNNHLKKGDEHKKSQPEPENTELNPGPEKADSDSVSKIPELKKKKRKGERDARLLTSVCSRSTCNVYFFIFIKWRQQDSRILIDKKIKIINLLYFKKKYFKVIFILFLINFNVS